MGFHFRKHRAFGDIAFAVYYSTCGHSYNTHSELYTNDKNVSMGIAVMWTTNFLRNGLPSVAL